MLQIFRFKRWRIIAATLLLTLSGCSALSLAYRQADGLAYWWLDGYLDFSTSQAQHARQSIARWFTWHRREQLPDYVALLGRAASEVTQDTTPANACRWFEDVRTRLDTALEHALPDATAIAASLGEEQLTHLERKQAKINAAFRDDFLQADPAVRRRAAVERAVERSEQLYGRLGPPQKERIAQAVSASPFEPERWLAERQRRQQDLLRTVRSLQTEAGSAAAREGDTAALRAYWQRVLHSPDEAYVRYQQKLDAYNCDFAAQVHNATTPEQRGAAQRRIRNWESDLRGLVLAP